MAAILGKKGRVLKTPARLPRSSEKATSLTRATSDAGAYFWVSGEHPVGETISFSIGIKTDWGTMAWVCQGKIVRKEQRGAQAGVAVKITRTAVEPSKERYCSLDGYLLNG